MSGCQRFLVNVSVWEHGNMWLARSEQMPLNISSNSLKGIHGMVIDEFYRHYTEKTGKLRIETDFVCLRGEGTSEGGGEEEPDWP